MEVTPDLITLAFEGHPIRCFEVGESLEWVAADVCAAVKLSGSAKTKALERLSPSEKVTRTARLLGRKQKLVVVTEAGLYHLLCHSDNTTATRFLRWLCREVLPAIYHSEMLAQLAAADLQIHQLKEQLEAANFTSQQTLLALPDLRKQLSSAQELAKWSERMNEFKSRQLAEQLKTINQLTQQLQATEQELLECQEIIVQTFTGNLGVKAMDILNARMRSKKTSTKANLPQESTSCLNC